MTTIATTGPAQHAKSVATYADKIKPAAAKPAPQSGLLLKVALIQLEASKLNPRKTFDDVSLRELADSIAQQGLLQNLVVRPLFKKGDDDLPSYQIISGERRFRALRLLEDTKRWDPTSANIPVKVIDNATDQDHLTLALVENLQRQDVNPMDEANAIRQLQRLDPKTWTTQAIADKIGCGLRLVQQRLALTERLGEPAQKALREGKINFSQARIIAQAAPAQQKDLVAAAEEGLDRDALRETLTDKLFETEIAIFDVAKSGLEIVEEGKKTYFRDSAAFMAAQMKAVNDKVAALRKEWAWAEKFVGYVSTYGYQRSKDKKKAGCIVEISKYHGTVKVHDGLIKPAERSSRGAAKPKTETAAQKTARLAKEKAAKDRAKAIGDFTRAMQTALASRPRLARSVVIFAQLQSGNSDWEPGHVMPAGLTERGRPLAKLGKLLKVSYGLLQPAKGVSDAQLWQAVFPMDQGDTDLAFAAWVATGLQVVSHKGEISPMILDLAYRMKVKVPEILQPPKEDAKKPAAKKRGK